MKLVFHKGVYVNVLLQMGDARDYNVTVMNFISLGTFTFFYFIKPLNKILLDVLKMLCYSLFFIFYLCNVKMIKYMKRVIQTLVCSLRNFD